MGILPYHLLQNKEFLSDRIMKHREEKKEEAQRVDPIVREVTLFEPSQGSSTTGTIVKISPPPPPPPQAATAAVAVATVAFKPKKKRLRIKTERRREQCRRNQERYRNKQRSMAIAIKEAVEILQEEVLALEKRRQTLYWSVNICQAPMKVVLEYFRFFRIGMNTPLPLPSLSPTLSRTSTTSTSSTSINTKKHFLRVVMEQDLQYGFFRGVEFFQYDFMKRKINHLFSIDTLNQAISIFNLNNHILFSWKLIKLFVDLLALFFFQRQRNFQFHCTF
jgi:hypothetical protein